MTVAAGRTVKESACSGMSRLCEGHQTRWVRLGTAFASGSSDASRMGRAAALRSVRKVAARPILLRIRAGHAQMIRAGGLPPDLGYGVYAAGASVAGAVRVLFS